MSEKQAPPASESRRRQRNWAVFLALAAFVLLVYAVTIVKIKSGQG